MRKTIPLEERFWSKVDKNGPMHPVLGTRCWIWTASKTAKGHGRVGGGGKRGRILKTNRVAWELSRGPIPDGLCACHSCDNPPCCNPDHLFLGTVADNNRDMFAKGRNSNGQELKMHCPHGHPYDEANTHIKRGGRSRSCRACGRAYYHRHRANGEVSSR